MSNTPRRRAADAADDGGHLDDLPDGCGCAEVWEHMSDVRGQAADD